MTTTLELYELSIECNKPWQVIEDYQIMAVMSELYDYSCPFVFMTKVLDEFGADDKSLVYCGSYEKCVMGAEMFDKIDGIVSKVQVV